MTPESVRKAASLIRTGEVYELGEVLTDDPAVSYINRGRVFNIYTKPSLPEPDTRVASEELVVTELGQIGTQLDGFAHQMYGDSFYNCHKFADIATVTRDKDGNPVAGSLDDAIESRDIWTFSREIDSPDPDWVLDETDAG